MKSILMLCPDPLDATSFYRGAGPFGHLKRQSGGLELLYEDPPKWPIYQSAHLAFFQRPSNGAHWHYIKQIKEWGMPLWIDYDDDLMSITPDNLVYNTYANNDVRQSLLAIIPAADVVTVSTEAIKQRYAHLNPNIYVIPNALDDRLVSYRKELPRVNGLNTVLWRGSHTHQKDLWRVADHIVRAAEKHEASRFYFQGYNPWFITERIAEHKALINGTIPIEAYFRLIHDGVRPDVCITPLWDSPFNKAKSNIAAIEAAFAGAPTIAPNWNEWKLPGAIRYTDDADFGAKLDDALARPDELRDRAKNSWDYVRGNLMLSQVNEKRAEILKTLLN